MKSDGRPKLLIFVSDQIEEEKRMLATCSDILQLWNAENYSLISEFGHDHLPANDLIKSVDWKKDNSNYLVFLYKQTGRVQLYDIQKNKSVELSTNKAQCCSFSQSGKYLTVTNEECQSHIWDVNSGRISQTFSSVDQSPMESICWGNGDSYLAAGTRKGNVFLYNQLTKQSFAPFTTKKDSNKLSSITSIKWSPHKDILATTSTDGCLSLWNCRLKELILSIHSHKAPATDLVFSPHHDAFLVSSGMDGSLSCLDIIQQKVLSTISIYSPLTSVDFHPNGSLIAVGTMGQNASIYDLRDPKQKIAHLTNSDHSNVYSVRFDINSSPTTTTTATHLQRPTTLSQDIKGLNTTFAQQTTRSRHTSASSTSSTPNETSRSSNVNPLRSTLNQINSTTNKEIRERSISSSSSSTINSNVSHPKQNEEKKINSNSIVHSSESMSFEEFAQLCGLSPQQSSNANGSHRSNENSSEIELRIESLLDHRLNSLREDLQEQLNQTKLSMQINFILQLEKVKEDLTKQIQSNSINDQLIEEIQRLRMENKRLRQLEPRI